MTRTLQSVLDDARRALKRAGLCDTDWTLAEVKAARKTQTGLFVGDLRWGSENLRFVAVDRSLRYRLLQHGESWQPGLSGAFWLRLVIDPRFGFQAEILDVDVRSLNRES